MSFEPFPKIPRHKKSVVVTEKIDGTNAQVLITTAEAVVDMGIEDKVIARRSDFDLVMLAGSRNRYIVPGDDNFAFALWVSENSDELWELGNGRHFGEWWGKGIQRGYGLDEKRFSLFNVSRPGGSLPECVGLVPTLYSGAEPNFDYMMLWLHEHGSMAAPGFDNPEGIVIYHTASRQMYKQTFEMDAGKWTQETA